MKKVKFLFLICIMFVICLMGCSENTGTISKSGFYFDTIITITLYDVSDAAILNECFDMAADYEALLSKTIETSDIYRINHSDGKPTKVDMETIIVLEKALEFSQLTDGIVDPTILPLSDLWNFGENQTVPAKSDIVTALSSVDYTKIVIDKEACTVTLTDSNAGIDLGFIAKGYIADKMKEYLLEKDVKNALINLGGNILTIGGKPSSGFTYGSVKNTPFTLGIREPFSSHSTPFTTVQVTDKSVVTSGVYERYFYENDVLYHHILDTHTGYPIDTGLLGVTILSDSSADGDAYSTICMCLGSEEGLKLIEQTDGVEALFITDNKELVYSSGFPR